MCDLFGSLSLSARQAPVAAELREADLYERYGDYYSYGFYIATRTTD